MTTSIPKVSYGQPTFRIKSGDTQPPITYTTVDEFQQLVVLTGAVSVQFIMRLRTALPATAVTRTATIVNADAGQLRYNWQAADTAIAGDYYVEWRVMFPSSQVQTFPIHGYQLVTVEADLS